MSNSKLEIYNKVWRSVKRLVQCTLRFSYNSSQYWGGLREWMTESGQACMSFLKSMSILEIEAGIDAC